MGRNFCWTKCKQRFYNQIKKMFRRLFRLICKIKKRRFLIFVLFSLILLICASAFIIFDTKLNSITSQKITTRLTPEQIRHITDLEDQLSSKTPCEMLASSTGKYRKITIARILGPSLKPLQSPQQTSLNLKHTLRYENNLKSSKKCIHSFWIIECSFNKTETQIITQTLKLFDEEFYFTPNCSKTPEALFHHIINLNNFRNYAIKLALRQNTDWILPLDGNIFLPSEALNNIVRGLVIASYIGSPVNAIPLFRILQCQNQLFTADFSFDKELSHSMMKYYRKFPTISERLTRKQEGQIAISTNFDNILNFFSDSYLYSKLSKMSLIEDLENSNYSRIRCGYRAGVELADDSRGRIRQYILNCGYVLRLLFWPENDTCSINARKPKVHNRSRILKERPNITDLIWISRKLRRRPEVNMQIRGRLRDLSALNLKTILFKSMF